MDSYQPIFDAVRSRLHNGDIGDAVYRAIRDAQPDHYFQMAAVRIQEAAAMYDLPSVIFKPTLSIDGNMWQALYGENLQEGVVGFGESPALAMQAFDKAWYEKLPNVALAEADNDLYPKQQDLYQKDAEAVAAHATKPLMEEIEMWKSSNARVGELCDQYREEAKAKDATIEKLAEALLQIKDQTRRLGGGSNVHWLATNALALVKKKEALDA